MQRMERENSLSDLREPHIIVHILNEHSRRGENVKSDGSETSADLYNCNTRVEKYVKKKKANQKNKRKKNRYKTRNSW